MVLGEALTRRADLQKRVAQTLDRILTDAVVQEGDEQTEDVADLQTQLEAEYAELETLVMAINQTNAHTRLPEPGDEELSMTLADALAERDILARRIGSWRQIAQAGKQRVHRYSASEIRMVRTIDPTAAQSKVDKLSKRHRELDTMIQACNWTTELEV